jgi:hypothetical protein
MPCAFTLRSLQRPFAALALLLVTAQAALAQVSNPPLAPVLINAFPSRDFVSAEGYSDLDRVIVKVIHPDGTIRSTDPANPLAPSGGIVEVNHPGGGCWWTITPDMRAFDVVQIDVVSGPNAGRSDAVTLSNMRVHRPIQTGPTTIEVHGTAQDGAGNPMPLGSIECRLLSPGDLFDLNNKRTIRAPGDGFIQFDAPGDFNWTATFNTLDAADLARALAADARVMEFIGLTGAIIFENGSAAAPGPMAGCNAPLEVLAPLPGSELVPPSAVTDLAGSVSNFNRVTLTWSPSTDNVGVVSYGVYRDGVAVANVQGPDGFAPSPTGFVENNAPAGTHIYTVDAGDDVGNRSPISNAVSMVAVAQPDPNQPANEPPVLPITMIVFPSRDFISVDGFLADDRVDVFVVRDGRVISSSMNQIPGGSIVEVNHPGGSCWEGTTPDLRFGDIVRTVARRPDGSIRTADQTHVSGVTCFTTVIVREDDPLTLAQEGIAEIHGSAVAQNGLPVPLDQIEQRMVARNDRFDLNGRRTLRASAGTDGTLSYDALNNPGGINWTARYVGLSGDDVARLRGGVSSTTGNTFDQSEPRIHWLGSNPALLNEATIYENSAGNPPGTMPGCLVAMEPLDIVPPTAPTGFSSVSEGTNAQRLSWLPSMDDWSVAYYRVFRDGQGIAQVGPTTLTYLDVNPPAGTHDYYVVAYDHATARGVGTSQEQQIIAGMGGAYGNASPPSDAGGSVQPDNIPPTVPANLVAVVGGANVSLNWSASTDNVIVAGYAVYRDGAKIADLIAPVTSYIDAARPVGTYSYSVDAVDGIGNRSAQSPAVSAIVAPVADVTAPSIPPSVVSTVSPDLHGRDVLITWGSSSDNVAVTGYSVYRDGVKLADLNAVTHSYTDVALATETYAYTVDAFDSANNRSAQSPDAIAVVANDPPPSGHSMIAFPSRDFISATGYPAADGPYTFTLFRGGTVVQSAAINSGVDGVVEVNHPGGTCWNVMTPDLRAGDVVRITNAAGIADQSTVANVTAQRGVATGPGTISVHGTAQDALGQPLPLGQLQHRIISAGALFDVNGRRDLRAGATLDGSLAYDAPGSPRWTAVYTGLSAADMLSICGGTDATGTVFIAAESRAVWLGRQPLALLEATIQETGPGVLGGPAGVCAAPAEALRPAATLAPGALSFGDVAYSPAATSAAQPVVFRNTGSATLAISAVYVAGLDPADFAYTGVVPATLAPGASFLVNVRFSPLALGFRQASINLDCDAANTTDLTVTLAGMGVVNPAPSSPGAPAASFVASSALAPLTGAALGNSTISVRLNWGASIGTLTGYELQQSTGGGAWSAVAAPPGSATSTTLALAMGTAAAPKSYQFRVRGMNGLNASPWSTAPAISLTPLDQTNTQVKFNGTWTNANLVGAYGGSVRFTSNNRSKVDLPNRATFTIPGSIAWVATMGPDRGQASVSVDKGPAVVVDLYSPTLRTAVVAFAANGLASGRAHAVTVQVLGTRSASSGGTRVDMDGFVLLNGSTVSAPLLASLAPAPIEDDSDLQPTLSLSFSNIAPNPSRGEAMMSFAIPRDGDVQLGIMDVQGRMVRNLHTGAMGAGQHHVTWDGRNAAGQSSQPGVYFAVLRVGDRSLVKRLVRVQ